MGNECSIGELIFFKDVTKDMAIALLPNAGCTILCAELVSQSDIGDNLSLQHKARSLFTNSYNPRGISSEINVGKVRSLFTKGVGLTFLYRALRLYGC